MFWQEQLPMFDYRLFYPQASIDDQQRAARAQGGQAAARVYRLQADRRALRQSGRR
jgi:hypothetical protein